MCQSGGRFDFDDGGVYCGAWEDGRAHGQGICTGPKGQGEYAGSWNHGFEVLGVYTWPSGNTYEGNWSMGKRHTLGIEVKGKWEYKGEWSHGYKGRYGIRSNTTSRAKYEGTWINGLQDGYGTETYADGGTYQGQWSNGMRHGYGVRQSVPYGIASVMRGPWKTSMNSLRSELSNGIPPITKAGSSSDRRTGSRAGFVLSRHPTVLPQTPAPLKRNRLFRSSSTSFGRSFMSGLKMRTKSNMSIASGASNKSCQSIETTDLLHSATTDYNPMYDRGGQTPAPFESIEDDIDVNILETYYGEWKNDARTGYGICKQTDGSMYEGQWLDNQRHGYGATTFPDGSKEEGKYKCNAICHGARRKNFPLKSNRIKTKVAQAVEQAKKAKETANQKADIAASRTLHSIGKAAQAETVAQNAREEAHVARCVARDQDPAFEQPGLEYIKQRGEATFSEPAVGGRYLTESQRRDVQGPESYFQYSNRETSGLQTQSASGFSEIGDGMGFSQNVTFKEDQRYERPEMDTMSMRSSLLSNGRNATNLSPKKVQSLSSGEPPLQRAIKKPDIGHLNDKIASSQISTTGLSQTPSLANADRPETASTRSFDIPSTPRQKKSLFRSFRTREKKISTSESGKKSPATSEVASVTNIDKLNRNANEAKVEPRFSTAQDRRKAFRKAYTAPERRNHSHARSMGSASFDYETNHDVYLASYESEMQQNEKVLPQDTLTPSADYRSHSSAPSHSDDLSLYVTAEKIKVPVVNSAAGNSQHFSSQPSWQPNNFDTRQVDQRGISRPYSSSSLAMTALRPRDADQLTQSTCQPVIPAFANYSGPASSQQFVAEQPSVVKNDSIQRANCAKGDHDTVFEQSVFTDEFSSALPHHVDTDYSPLPSKLRRRVRTSSATSSDLNITAEQPELEAGKAYLVVLIVLLFVGFLAVFLQFLT